MKNLKIKLHPEVTVCAGKVIEEAPMFRAEEEGVFQDTMCV